MGNTLCIDMGNTFSGVVGVEARSAKGCRVGFGSASASAASRSGAETNAARAIWILLLSLDRQIMGEALEAPSIFGRAHSGLIGLPQLSYQQIDKVYCKFSRIPRLQSHWISHKRFANEALASKPFDLSIAPYSSDRPSLRILQLHSARDPTPWLVKLGRRPLPQSLMRTDLVVNPHPTIEPSLLSPQIARWGPRRFRFEHPVHLLVPSVLLRMAWRYEFDTYAQSCPPGTQTRKPCWADGSKGHSIVHADDFRIALLQKQTHKNLSYRLPRLIPQQANSHQIPAEHVSHGQRLDPLAILGAKPSFEVHRPNMVASAGLGQISPAQPWPAPRTPTAPRQLQAPQPIGDRPHRGNLLARILFAQPNSKLLASPAPMSPSQPANPFQPLDRNLSRRMMWTTAQISQTLPTLPFEPCLPLVAALATDSELPTQLRHAFVGLQSQLHKGQPPYCRGDFFPRHAREKRQK